MKKVSWPQRKEVWGTTLVTIIATVILSVYLYLADYLLGVLIRTVYFKLGA
jgi:preprotein translocase subunit SecE